MPDIEKVIYFGKNHSMEFITACVIIYKVTISAKYAATQVEIMMSTDFVKTKLIIWRVNFVCLLTFVGKAMLKVTPITSSATE